MGKLEGKIALVPGSGRNIGRATVLKLAAEGARVCVNYANDVASATQTVQSIEIAGGSAILCRADVTRAALLSHWPFTIIFVGPGVFGYNSYSPSE